MAIHLGITGTRYGANDKQLAMLAKLLLQLKPAWVHHGLCLGFDEQAHHAVRAAFARDVCRVHGHPQLATKLQAGVVADCDVLSKPRAPLARNLDIVAATDLIIAAPFEMDEMRHGGTWYTIRAARLRRRRLYVILPNGRIEDQTHD